MRSLETTSVEVKRAGKACWEGGLGKRSGKTIRTRNAGKESGRGIGGESDRGKVFADWWTLLQAR
jgi:hypothetical protein